MKGIYKSNFGFAVIRYYVRIKLSYMFMFIFIFILLFGLHNFYYKYIVKKRFSFLNLYAPTIYESLLFGAQCQLLLHVSLVQFNVNGGDEI